jgi:hypothetical protein
MNVRKAVNELSVDVKDWSWDYQVDSQIRKVSKIIKKLKDCEFKTQLNTIISEAKKLKEKKTEEQTKKIITLIKAAKEKIMTIDEKVITKPSKLATGITILITALTLGAYKANAQEPSYGFVTTQDGQRQRVIVTGTQMKLMDGTEVGRLTGNTVTQEGTANPAFEINKNNTYQKTGPLNNNPTSENTTSHPQDTYNEKIRQLDEQIRQNPNQAAPYIALADFYIKQNNDINKVIEIYEKALPRAKYMSDKDNAQIRYNLAIRYYNKNNINKSKEMFGESLRYDSSNKDARIMFNALKTK